MRKLSAHTLRGLIRSMQLRTDEAGRCFSRARKGFLKDEKTIPNLMYGFLLEAFRFENALVEAPVDQGISLPRTRFPELPEAVGERYPEVVFALNFRKQTEAILRLHIGELREATALFRELIKDHLGISFPCRGRAFPSCPKRQATLYRTSASFGRSVIASVAARSASSDRPTRA